MKKIIILAMALSLSTAKVHADTFWEEYKVPVITCGIAVAGATAVGIKVPFGIGVCIGVGAYHILSEDQRRYQYALLDEKMKEHELKFLQHAQKTTRDYSAYREAIREIVVESIGKKETSGTVDKDQIKKEILEETKKIVMQEKEKIISDYVKEVIEQ